MRTSDVGCARQSLGEEEDERDPEKTRLVRFEKPTSPPSPAGGDGAGGGPTSFDLLGFTHFWGKSRKGNWVVKKKTAKDRFSRTLRRIATWCKLNRHLPIKDQHTALARKLRGHDAYYGLTGNARALVVLRLRVQRIWQTWLNRRSWKAKVTWTRMNQLLGIFPLPPARVVHSIYRAANQ
jgi:RNA-directed DNA polymerase